MKSVLLLSLACALAAAQFYGNGGPPFCLITGRQLYSHGNFIRELNDTEMHEFDVYKNSLAEYQRALSLVFSNPTNLTTSLPVRPPLPHFCTSSDTTLYILGHCSVQNYKLYVGTKFARDLSPFERGQLDQFAARLRENQFKSAQADPSAGNSTAAPPPNHDLSLTFCQEL